MRLIPYETPAPVHTAGLSMPLAAYVNLLYTAKSFTVDCEITSVDGTMTITGTLDRQRFTGPQPIDPPTDEGSWGSQMVSGTRRVCVGNGSDPLRYHDPDEYLAGGGTKVIAGWMNWVGDLDWAYVPTTGSTSSGTEPHNFYLPVASYPLWWEDSSAVVSGIKKAAGSGDWLIYKEGEFNCGSGPRLNAYYGSSKHIASDPYEAIDATLVTADGTYTFVEAGPGYAGVSLSGHCTLTVASTW